MFQQNQIFLQTRRLNLRRQCFVISKTLLMSMSIVSETIVIAFWYFLAIKFIARIIFRIQCLKFINLNRKLNECDDLPIHPLPAGPTRGNDYLETVAFMSCTSNHPQSNDTTEGVATSASETTEKDTCSRKPHKEKARTPLNKKQKHHLYHNVFKTGSYENV